MPPFSYTLAQHLELTYLEYEALRQHYFEHWCAHLSIPLLTKNDH